MRPEAKERRLDAASAGTSRILSIWLSLTQAKLNHESRAYKSSRFLELKGFLTAVLTILTV